MKISNISFIFIFLFHFANAQDNLNKIDFGIEAGPDAASQRGGFQNNNQQTLWGFSAGFTGQYNLTPKFSIRSGIGFEEKGYSILQTFTTVINPQTGSLETDGTINGYSPMDYLILPVFAKYRFGKSRIKFFAEGGPYLGYLINAEQTISYKPSTGSAYISRSNETQHYNRFEGGAGLGMGADRQITNRLKILIELRYNLGLTDIVPPSTAPGFTGIYNESVCLTLGLMYQLSQIDYK